MTERRYAVERLPRGPGLGSINGQRIVRDEKAYCAWGREGESNSTAMCRVAGGTPYALGCADGVGLSATTRPGSRGVSYGSPSTYRRRGATTLFSTNGTRRVRLRRNQT